MWILRHGKTRTRVHLHRIGCLPSPRCPFCPNRDESLQHLFFACPRLRLFWRKTLGGARSATPSCVGDAWDVFRYNHRRWDAPTCSTVFSGMLWVLWKARNRMVFDSVRVPLPDILASVTDHLLLWKIRAPSRLDFSGVEQWCASLCVVNRCLTNR